jgi:hypothetical protein
MCGCSGQKGNTDFLDVINRSATFLAFEKPGKSGFLIELTRVYPNVGNDESLNVLLITSFAFERSSDAKPVNILIQFHMREGFRSSTLLTIQAAFFEYPYRHFQYCSHCDVLRVFAMVRMQARGVHQARSETPLRPQLLRA